MVIDITPKKFTLESAYYECVLECHDAISNGMITALTESAGTEVLNEGFKETFKNIINKIVTALRNLKNNIVKKFNELKVKLKGKKEVADKVDEATKKVEDTFEAKKDDVESLADNIEVTISAEAMAAMSKKAQEKADKAAQDIRKSGIDALNSLAGTLDQISKENAAAAKKLEDTKNSAFESISSRHAEFNQFLKDTESRINTSHENFDEKLDEIDKLLDDLMKD